MLAYANIRKTKGHTISLFLMFGIAALLLNVGLLISFNFGNYFDKITKDMNTSDIYYIMPETDFTEEVEQYMTNHENMKQMETVDPMWAQAEIEYNGGTKKNVFIFCNADATRSMTRWKFVGKHLPADDMSIYLPYLFQLVGGYELNDTIHMKLKDTELSFTIKGFTEDVFYSSPETVLMGVYLPQDTYEKVDKQLGESYHAALVLARLYEVNKDIETGIRDITGQKSASAQTDITRSLYSMDLPMVKFSRTMMPSMMSIMVVVFAAIIVIVCLIVVRFRINNSLEEDMTKIGSLKAVGYTSRQIILSVLLQYTVIAFVGSIVGIALSYLTTPALSDIFAQQSGIKWVQDFDGVISGIAFCIILLIVAVVALASSSKIRKLHPIIALRGGIVTHSFRKNHMPLSTSRGRLPFVLAMKALLQNKKQSFMIVFILIVVSFAQAFAVVMFYNTTVDTTAFLETPGIELSNAVVVFKPDTDVSKEVDEIRKLEEVRKVQFIDEVIINIDDVEVSSYIMDDYSGKETRTVYTGRYPIHSNEIVLAGHLAEMLGKTKGDMVLLSMGDVEVEFVVSGLSQGGYMGGINSSITYEGMLMLNPDFHQQSLNIYLDKGTDAAEFLKMIESKYESSIIFTQDMDKNIEQGAGVYTSIVSLLGIAIMFITVAVVVLVLYFIINSTVVRRKRELGIQKAIGYTTWQLMNQISIGFLVPVFFGVCIGSFLGATLTNVIMTAVQRGMGIMKAGFIVTPTSISIFGIAIILLSYAVSMLITYRIRKISAYALVSE